MIRIGMKWASLDAGGAWHRPIRGLRGAPRRIEREIEERETSEDARPRAITSRKETAPKQQAAAKKVKKTDRALLTLLDGINQHNQHKTLAKIVTPLYNIPYDVQLQIKYKKNRSLLQKLYTHLADAGAKIVPDPQRLPCPLEEVCASPVTEAYRNKDEFCIFRGIDGDPKTVGFLIGNLANESTVCVNPDSLIITQDSHKQVAKAFQNYIRSSPLQACLNFRDGGHWRNVIVRSNQSGDVMAAVIMHPQSLTKDDLNSEKEKLAEYFTVGSGRSCNLASLYFQACPHTRCSSAVSPFELLFGVDHIVEEVHGMRYHISPGSFFQVNTEAAAILLQVIKEVCNPKQDATTVLDICCGTGTSSIYLARHAKKVIGIDVKPEAILDAKLNCDKNGLSNAEFVEGHAESLIPDLLQNSHFSEDLVVLFNPGRGGLEFPAIRAVRECKHVKRVVYVTCKAEGQAMNNFIQLCKPAKSEKKMGDPFHPVIAIPVDLFPHTHHCELVVLFQR